MTKNDPFPMPQYKPQEPYQESEQQLLEELALGDLVRSGAIIAENTQPESEMYRGIFLGKNFHLYHRVKADEPGNFRHEEGYQHVWGNIKEGHSIMPPAWVPRKPKQVQI
jgi:hypothetical protein